MSLLIFKTKLLFEENILKSNASAAKYAKKRIIPHEISFGDSVCVE